MVNELRQILFDNQIFINEPMKEHTTFRAGGNADFFVVPKTADELERVVGVCRDAGTQFLVLGNGSNVLFKDSGYRGVVISTKGLNYVELTDENVIKAGAGVMLKEFCDFAEKNELTGAEFVCGIPGTVGGAVFMNAGAYDSEIKDIFFVGEFLSADGVRRVRKTSEMGFGYRTSVAQTHGLIVLSAVFELKGGVKSDIEEKINSLTERREDKQPLEMPSAGSTFKRPEGRFAGKLIMDSGLAGFTIGGAAVSTKHCGFVVNQNNATADDILAVIEHVQKTVLQKFGVALEPEVKIV